MNRYSVKPPLRWLSSLLFCLLAAGCGTFDITARVQVDAVPTPTPVDRAEAPSTATPIPVVPTSVPIDLPTATPIPTQLPTAVPPTMGSGTVQLAGFPLCFNLDNGIADSAGDEQCEFNLYPEDSGSGLWVLEPIVPAQFGFGGVFPAPPTPEECSTSPHLSGTSEIIAPMASMYVCYQTGDGRFGYLHFVDVDESATRLTLAWNTFVSGGPNSAAPLSYTNPEFGLSLSLPPTWEGYEATVTATSDGANICFTFTGSLPICVLQIDIYTQEAWQNLGTVPDGYYIDENADYVFAAGPYSTECVQLDAFQCERYQEIPQVLTTLQVDAPR